MQPKLSYKKYHKFFRENSKFSTQQLKTDVCDYCIECNVKLSEDSNDLCKEQFRIHTIRFKEHSKLRNECVKNL